MTIVFLLLLLLLLLTLLRSLSVGWDQFRLWLWTCLASFIQFCLIVCLSIPPSCIHSVRQYDDLVTFVFFAGMTCCLLIKAMTSINISLLLFNSGIIGAITVIRLFDVAWWYVCVSTLPQTIVFVCLSSDRERLKRLRRRRSIDAFFRQLILAWSHLPFFLSFSLFSNHDMHDWGRRLYGFRRLVVVVVVVSIKFASQWSTNWHMPPKLQCVP